MEKDSEKNYFLADTNHLTKSTVSVFHYQSFNLEEGTADNPELSCTVLPTKYRS